MAELDAEFVHGSGSGSPAGPHHGAGGAGEVSAARVRG